MPRPTTYYSNIVNIQTTPTELLFEFGVVFPEKPPTGPVEFEPEVRVVLSLQALQGLSQGLQKAIEQVHAQQQNVPPQPEALKKTSH